MPELPDAGNDAEDLLGQMDDAARHPEDEHGGVRAVPFQFRDVRGLAAKILHRANDVAQKRMQDANKHVESIEKEAEARGFQKGQEEGRVKGESEGRATGEAAGREEFLQHAQPVAGVLEALLTDLQGRKIGLVAQAEADLLDLALAIARRVVRREIRSDPAYILPTVREAIALAADRSSLVVVVAPDDLGVMESELPRLRAAFTDLGKITLEADETMERGGARVKTLTGEVDMRLATQFATLERSLLGEGLEGANRLDSPVPKAPADPDLTGAPAGVLEQEDGPADGPDAGLAPLSGKPSQTPADAIPQQDAESSAQDLSTPSSEADSGDGSTPSSASTQNDVPQAQSVEQTLPSLEGGEPGEEGLDEPPAPEGDDERAPEGGG